MDKTSPIKLIDMPQKNSLGAVGLLALLLLNVSTMGCRSAKVAEPLTDKLASNDPATQLEFWHTLADRPVTSNDEAFHGLILFIDGEDNNKDYAARVEQLSARQMLPSGFDEPGEEAVKRGTVAGAFTRVLEVTGGVSMQLFGPTPRYAARELQYMRLFPQGSPHQTLSGREFLGVIGRIEDHQRTDHPVDSSSMRAEQPETETP